MEMRGTEFDIPEDECKALDVSLRNDPVEVTDPNIGTTEDIDENVTKIYTPLKTVDFGRFKSPAKLSITPIKSSREPSGHNSSTSYGCSSLSPKKLGVSTSGRSNYEKLKSKRKIHNVDRKQREQAFSDVGTSDEHEENVESLDPVISNPKVVSRVNKSNGKDESDDDIFASQELENCGGASDNTNIRNDSQQLTLSKAMGENSKDNVTEDEKLILTPQSVGRESVCSDSEFDRVCEAIKNNNFDPRRFSFDTMDLLDDFDDLADATNDKILSKVLELSFNNQEGKQELSEGISTSIPTEVNVSKHDADGLYSEERTRKRTSTSERRRSSRLLEKSITETKKSDPPTVDPKLKEVQEKIKQFEKRQAISPAILEELQCLDIRLQQEPLPQHQLEIHLCRPPTVGIKKAFVEYGPLKKGSFSKAEDKIIKKNWKSFCIDHNWDPHNVTPFLTATIRRRVIMTFEQRLKFTQYLAQGLPWRLLSSVYRRFKTLYSNVIRDRKFTPEEDAQILLYMANEAKYSQKTLKLAQIMNRTKFAIYKRYYYMTNRKERAKKEFQWDLPSAEKFLKYLLEVTLSKDIYELKSALIPKIVWIRLEKKLKIPHEAMIKFWFMQLHAQLFCTRPIYDNDIKIMLIEYMYVKGVSSRKELSWPSIARYFDGLTPYYLIRKFDSILRYVPLKRRKHLAGVIAWLYEKKIPQWVTKIKDKCLPRLIYEYGKIKIIDEFPDTSSSSSSVDSSESD